MVGSHFTDGLTNWDVGKMTIWVEVDGHFLHIAHAREPLDQWS